MRNADDGRRQPNRNLRVLNGLLPALFLISVAAHAGSFEERVNNANAAFATEPGEAYDRKLVPLIQEAIRKCAPAGPITKQDFGKFVLVADVSLAGKLVDPAARPETKTSVCFTREFGGQILPAPPVAIVSDGFAPIVVEVYIVP